MRASESALSALAALDDDVRRRLYLYVRSQTHPASRDEAAAAVGISRKLAAFHLDKLVERRLLRATYGHPSGRPKDQPGRSSKLYEPTDLAVELTLPERRYDLLARALAEAVTSGGTEAVACEVARRKGAAAGRHARGARGRTLEASVRVLERHGFEPAPGEGGTVELRNCPFQGVARQSPDLVCRMNLAFIEGVLAGLEAQEVDAVLDPAPGRCCVTLEENQQTTTHNRDHQHE